MLCQAADCFKLAQVSDSRTSLEYCRAHYFLAGLETFQEQVARLQDWYRYFNVEPSQ